MGPAGAAGVPFRISRFHRRCPAPKPKISCTSLKSSMRASIYFSLLLLGLVITSSAAVWQFYFRQSPNMLRPRENDSSLASIPIHSIESSSVTSDAEYDEAVTSAPSAIVREIIATYAPTAAVAAATTTPPAVKEWLQGSKHNLVMIDDSFMLPAFEPSTALDPPVIGFGKYLNQNIHLSLESSEVHKNSNPKHQAAVFDLLRAATKVFDALNISYFLSHGTLLGSFRHGDMLKWDYDIDSTSCLHSFLSSLSVCRRHLFLHYIFLVSTLMRSCCIQGGHARQCWYVRRF